MRRKKLLMPLVLWALVYIAIITATFPVLLIILDKNEIKFPEFVSGIIMMAYETHTFVGDNIVVMTGSPSIQRLLGWVMNKPTKNVNDYIIPIITDEIARYPSGVLISKGIRGIVIGTDYRNCVYTIFCNDEVVEGGRAQRSIGLIAVSLYRNERSQRLLVTEAVHIIHHEIGHYFTNSISKEAWINCNNGMPYLGSGWDINAPAASMAFVTTYARANPDEDIAETVAVFMETPSSQHYVMIKQPEIACKYNIIKRVAPFM